MADILNIAIGGLAAVTISTAFVDQDRRGLAFFTEPEIFAVEESIADVQPTEFPIMWGEPLGSPVERKPISFTKPQENRADTPFRQALLTPQNPTDPFQGNSNVPSRQAVNVSPSEPESVAQGNVNSQPNPTSIVPSESRPTSADILPAPQAVPVIASNIPRPSPGGTVIASPVTVVPPQPVNPLDPVTPVDPVVPAVPEPSSWLMMILGVGLLGLMLRYRRETESIETDAPMLNA